MASFREGKILELREERRGLIRAIVRIGDVGGEGSSELVASGFPHMIGRLSVGDRVIVNTTGMDLELGTGGEGFILWNLDEPAIEMGPGHIVKVRYTPWQSNVLAVEAPESEHHVRMTEAVDLGGCPVVACGLHSQIAGVVAGIKAARPDARIGYVMSDAGALPLAWSDLVADLRGRGAIDVTCTYGHAFGGDIEAVNLFSALVATRTIGRIDVIVAAMGPGGVGTGTRLGFSGIEQGQVLDATTALGGRAIACVRISFSDQRERHHGISHHGVTALTVAASRPATVVLPTLSPERTEFLRRQCEEAGIHARHDVLEADGEPGIAYLRSALGLDPATMGRKLTESPEPFLAAAAAGVVAAGTLA